MYDPLNRAAKEIVEKIAGLQSPVSDRVLAVVRKCLEADLSYHLSERIAAALRSHADDVAAHRPTRDGLGRVTTEGDELFFALRWAAYVCDVNNHDINTTGYLLAVELEERAGWETKPRVIVPVGDGNETRAGRITAEYDNDKVRVTFEEPMEWGGQSHGTLSGLWPKSQVRYL